MSVLTSYTRALAVKAGRAQPIATRRHYHLSPRPLVLIPLKLAGEAAAPLAVLVGPNPDDPTLFTVPQPRDRVLRLRMVDDFARLVLAYLDGFAADVEETTNRNGDIVRCATDAPQVWVPNPAGVEFLGHLGMWMSRQMLDGDNAVPETTPRLGAWLNWLTARAQHPGSAVMPVATSVLSSHWASGQSGLEDGNLAALLGWIDPPPGLDGPAAAALAEDPLRTPPAGPATDPGYDNEELGPLITAYDRAETKVRAAQRIDASLRAQLMPTWTSMWRALELLAELPEAQSVAQRWDSDRKSFTRQADRIADGSYRSYRESAVRAARRLADEEQADESFSAQRAFDDPLVMSEHLLAGTAYRGTVEEIDPVHRDMSDGGRGKLRPRVVIRPNLPLRPAVGATLYRVGQANQKAHVRELDEDLVVLWLEGGLGKGNRKEPEAGTVPEEGDVVTFTQFSPKPSGPPVKLPPREETPWTHGGPPPEIAGASSEPADSRPPGTIGSSPQDSVAGVASESAAGRLLRTPVGVPPLTGVGASPEAAGGAA
ncbi:hypothetical protein [Nocardia stercoris]|uniref:hypothetical protein n=1 Tax=Nocardia stercoris TaxID=2483361 RepID=UPI0018F6F955|nr:hypothetical protein [Nocardia stercoris]